MTDMTFAGFLVAPPTVNAISKSQGSFDWEMEFGGVWCGNLCQFFTGPYQTDWSSVAGVAKIAIYQMVFW